MKGHTHCAGSGIRLTLLLITFGCLLAGGLAGVIFQPSSAAQDDSTRINPKVIHPSPDSVSGTLTSQEDLQPALLPPADMQSEQLSASPNPGGYVIETDGEQSICRDATEEEARSLRRRDPEQQLRAINDEGASALSPTQSPSQSVDGLKIILRGTPQLEQFPVAKAAFIRAAQRWEAVIQNPITIVIDVDFGPTRFGETFPTNILGSTAEQEIGADTIYPGVRSALIGRASNAQEAALYNALPQSQLPTDIGAITGVYGSSAVFRGLGIIKPVADPDGERGQFGPPPSIGFNSGMQFDFDPSNGIEPGKVDFDATATHEIGHALGFISEAGLHEQIPSISLRATTWDLFRFRPGVTTAAFSTAQRILSSGGQQVFFGGEPELGLSTGRPNATGGDGRQASHWKDDEQTGRYIGIMDPTLSPGKRMEITENDLKALDLMGYQLKPNANPNPTPTPTPPPSQQTVELKLDDGSLETGAISNGLIVVNRLTPPSYPATLQKLRFIFAAFQNQPDPTGKPITVMIFTDPNGSGQPPSGAQITRINITVPGTSLNNFFDMNISNGPTIYSGDFYIGFQAPSPHQGVGFFLDTSGQSPNRCFYSSDGGAGYSLLAPALQLNSANAMIRAVVSTGGVTPTPTPTPPPGGNTVALTSGLPQTGSIAAPAQGSGEIGTTQYTIQVPVGATRLKVDLTGNPDVDLYVRFGNRIQLQGGDVVADIKSESPTGAESVTITPGGSPALQAGTYYIAVGNYGPGPANFTLTATVTGAAPTPTPTPQPGGNTVALTSGSPQTGSAGAPAPGSAELGLTQYTIQVPNGATQLKVDLSGNTDVDLYLRFGARVTIQNDGPVADFKSESQTGAESITVTPGSSPALRAGLYYIAVGNYGPGAATFTVTATVTGGPTPTPTPTPTPPPGGNNVALTSGAPQFDSLVAPEPGGAVLGDRQYTIQVPNGATQLKVELSGNTNVDLFVRYGARIAIQNEGVVTDFGSETAAKNESITVTPGGSPALRAGVYYIAVGNVGPGVAYFTVTATVTGGGGNCSFTISPTNRTISASGALGAVNVTTSAGCNWTATSNASFINLLPPASGSGSGSITYSVGTNTGASSRTGTLTVAGQTFTLTQDGTGSPPPVNVGSVSAANYDGSALAAESIVAAFGVRLATTVLIAGTPECPLCLPTELGGTRVMVKDSAGTQRLAPLFFVSPNQVNYLMPAGTAVGTATVTVTSGDGAVSIGTAQIATVAPGLFTANGDGLGAPAAFVMRIKQGASPSFEGAAQYDSTQRRFVPRPLDLGAATDQIFLILFGTGLRHRQDLSTVSLKIGGVSAPLYFAGAHPDLAGLDQINALLPRSLIGRGEVEVTLVVDGKPATTVRINVQ